MNKILSILLIVLVSHQVFSQSKILRDDELNKMPTYKSLPDSNYEMVYKAAIENIGVIPKDINKYKNLQQFTCYGNDSDYQLDTIPELLFELKNLTHLTFARTNIHYISPSISKLENLEELYLSDNKILTLPASLSALTSLKVLYIDGSVPAIPPLPQIEKLNYTVFGMDTIKIYSTISEMKNLQRLYFDGWGFINIKDLTNKIKDLPRLEEISFNLNYVMTEKEFAELNKVAALKKIKVMDYGASSPAYIKKYPKVVLTDFK
jgi:Leucine-rich repeat (LRR) protein